MKILLTSVLMILTALTAVGREPADSVKVYFRAGHRQFDPSFADNRAAMDRFVDGVRQADKASGIDSIIVHAYASPDGFAEANTRLAHNRCQTIIDMLSGKTGVSRNIFHAVPEGVAWTRLREMVAENPKVPSREKVLDILDNTPLWIFDSSGKVVSGRKKQLMALDGGVPYRWMLEKIFPELRNAIAVSLYVKRPSLPEEKENTELSETSEMSEIPEQSGLSEDIMSAESSEQPDTSGQSYGSEQPETPGPSETSELSAGKEIQPFVVKTNLLYYAALMPNLELEWMFRPNWSVALEGNVAWYSKNSQLKTYQLAVVSPELRYWIRPRSMWHGMYAGVFTGGGLYDFENGGNGYQGEGIMAGLSAGYMWPVSRSLSLEAGIGAGYMYTRYKEYEPHDGHFLYMRTRSINYFGPLKLKFSLVWRFLKSTNKNKSIR